MLIQFRNGMNNLIVDLQLLRFAILHTFAHIFSQLLREFFLHCISGPLGKLVGFVTGRILANRQSCNKKETDFSFDTSTL